MNRETALDLLKKPLHEGAIVWDYGRGVAGWKGHELDIAGRIFTADQLRALLYFHDAALRAESEGSKP